MSIYWRDPKNDPPQDGRFIAVAHMHPKGHVPLSFNITFGVVESSKDVSGERLIRVVSNDFDGHGTNARYFNQNYNDDDNIVSWANACEFDLGLILESL